MTHLLVTNDFPPKVGGIQTYLWELWRRLPPDEFTVLTTPYAGDRRFDAEQPFRVERVGERMLFPTRSLASHVDALAQDVGADLVVLDPALPLGLVGRRLRRPYAVVVHGAEVTVPGRLPGANRLMRRVLTGATHLIAAGGYPADEARRAAGPHVPITIVPPGVDTERFVPMGDEDRAAARAHFGLPVDGRLVVSVSRLVPRKGMDVLTRAAARLASDRPDLTVAIAGDGRDRARLERLCTQERAPMRLLGRVDDERLPALYGSADVFAMLCRNRWAGLEQEGFGIVFAEAAACGVPQVAGDSGGAAEAVLDGETGLVVRRPADTQVVVAALAELLDDGDRRAAMGAAARHRAVAELSWPVLARRLHSAIIGS